MGERAAAAIGAEVALAAARPAELILTAGARRRPGRSVRAAGDDEPVGRHRPGPGRRCWPPRSASAGWRRRRRRPSTGGRWRRRTWPWPASALLAAAELRAESRGCHVRTDHPERHAVLGAVGAGPSGRRRHRDRGGRSATGRGMGLSETTRLAHRRRRAVAGPGGIGDRPRAHRGPAGRPGRHHAVDGARRSGQPGRASPPGRRGVLAGGPVALAVFDMVLGSAGTGRSTGRATAVTWSRGAGADRHRPDRRHPDRRTDRAEPADPPVRDRHADPQPGWTRSPAPARGSGTPARRCPGLRALEKYAVRCGGGRQPPDEPGRRRADQGQPRGGGRFGPRRDRGGPPRAARTSPLEVEVDTLDQFDEALAAGAELVLLDNFSTRRHGGGGAPGAARPDPRCCWRPPAG